MPRNVLFLCTANSARSILAEAILAARGGDRFAAFSAGSQPRGVPNPRALELLTAKGHDVSGIASKSWDVFAGPNAPPMDLVITVCDNAKGEVCPIFPGHPAQAHWGIPDPAGHGTDGALADFELAYRRLGQRIEALVALAEDTMEQREWRDAVTRIGREMEGATHG
jgi:arsenate reductase